MRYRIHGSLNCVLAFWDRPYKRYRLHCGVVHGIMGFATVTARVGEAEHRSSIVAPLPRCDFVIIH